MSLRGLLVRCTGSGFSAVVLGYMVANEDWFGDLQVAVIASALAFCWAMPKLMAKAVLINGVTVGICFGASYAVARSQVAEGEFYAEGAFVYLAALTVACTVAILALSAVLRAFMDRVAPSK